MPTMIGLPRDVVTPTLPQEQPTYGASVWHGRLASGDVLMADLPAGAKVLLHGAGKLAEVVATRRVWLRIAVPNDAGLRAAQYRSTPALEVGVEAFAGR
eukprot:11218630-Lingulodinium_polyedra.AAC.1